MPCGRRLYRDGDSARKPDKPKENDPKALTGEYTRESYEVCELVFVPAEPDYEGPEDNLLAFKQGRRDKRTTC